jgi:hypothetical protein
MQFPEKFGQKFQFLEEDVLVQAHDPGFKNR